MDIRKFFGIQKKDTQKRQLGRHPRIPFTSHQLSVLEEKFKESPYLSSEEVIVMSKKLQLADIRVKIWFQNRRARERREKNGLIGDNTIKGDKKPSQENSVDDNKLFCAPNLNTGNINSTETSNSSISDSHNLRAHIKSEVNTSLSFCPDSVFALSRNVRELLDVDSVSSSYFVAHGVPFLVPAANFVNNIKDTKS